MVNGSIHLFGKSSPSIIFKYSLKILSLLKNLEEKNGRQTIVCQDCGKDFVFTVGEQEFYKEKGFDNEPKRCKECRDRKKNERRQFRNDR